MSLECSHSKCLRDGCKTCCYCGRELTTESADKKPLTATRTLFNVEVVVFDRKLEKLKPMRFEKVELLSVGNGFAFIISNEQKPTTFKVEELQSLHVEVVNESIDA